MEKPKRSDVARVVYEEVILIMKAEGLGDETAGLEETTCLLRDLGFGSLSLLDLAVSIERALGFQFGDMEDWAGRIPAGGQPGISIRTVIDASYSKAAAATG